MTLNTFTARCSRKYFPAANDSGHRSLNWITAVVIHCTEGSSDEGAAAYFHGDTTRHAGSTQLVLDDDTCYRCLPDDVIPWGAPPLNSHGVHIEQAGFVEWSRAEWMKHERTIQRAAAKTAMYCRAYHIPARFIEVPAVLRQMGEAARGITSHLVVSSAFGLSTHTDPGPNYPYGVFMDHVRFYL